jgi:hypothetical protein
MRQSKKNHAFNCIECINNEIVLSLGVTFMMFIGKKILCY